MKNGLEYPRRLADPRYSAEPKLDGQARPAPRARECRTVHAFSRPGRELIRLPGLAWLHEIRWPVAAAVLDGEAVAGDGSERIQAVFEARTRLGSPMAFAAFDVVPLARDDDVGVKRSALLTAPSTRCYGPRRCHGISVDPGPAFSFTEPRFVIAALARSERARPSAPDATSTTRITC